MPSPINKITFFAFNFVDLPRGDAALVSNPIKTNSSTPAPSSQDASNKILTKQCPRWLKVENDKFVIIPEYVEIIEWIYEQSIAGHGAIALCKKLNEDKIPTFKQGRKGWHSSFISRIMSSRKVLGEYQPQEYIDGRRVNAGPVIKDYFPKIISDETYYQGASARKARLHRGGRKGTKNANILQHLVFCADCGSTMRFISKGKKSSKYLSYLTCSNAMQHRGCNHNRFYRYSALENMMISLPTQMDYTKYFSGNVANYDKKIVSKTQHLTEISVKLKKLASLMISNAEFNIDEMSDAIKELSLKREHLKSELEIIKQQKYTSVSDSSSIFERVVLIIQKMNETDDPEALYNFRVEWADKLKKVIHQVRFSEYDEFAITIVPILNTDESTDEIELEEWQINDSIIYNFEQFKHTFYD